MDGDRAQHIQNVQYITSSAILAELDLELTEGRAKSYNRPYNRLNKTQERRKHLNPPSPLHIHTTACLFLPKLPL